MAGLQGTEWSYIGKGSCYLAIKGSTDPLRAVGNVSEITVSASEDKKELPDSQNAGGGMANTLRRPSAVEVSMAMRDFVAENIALATRGAVSEVTSGSVTSEAVTARLDGLTPLAHINPSSVVVTNVAGTTTYVANTDYIVTTGGIFIPATSTIPDDTVVHVDYSYSAQRVVQALVNAGLEYVMRIVGLNEAKSGKPVVVDFHRLIFGPTQELSFIGDDYGTLQVAGDALKDATITGAGLSQYFKVTYVE